MPYELNASDIHNFAAIRNDRVKQNGDELNWLYCPYCNGGKDRDKYTFSVNLESGAFKCLRATCGMQGHFVQLARYFGYQLDFGKDERHKKQYKKLPQKEIKTTTAAEAYLFSRSISKDIAEKYKISTRNDNDKILVFPFYDEKGVLQFVKYRKTDFDKQRDKNKEWSEKDTKPILFGMWQCKDFSRLIITEGQIDSLSVAEAGIENAVSVPTGAMGFTWISHCWEWLTKFERIVVFGDNENGEITLVKELSKRFPRLEVVKSEYYLGEKDANDILRKYGKQAIIEAVNSARMPPVNHIKLLADVEKVDLTALPKIKTGIDEIDRIIGGIYFGQVVLLSGKRGEGKSTFMSQLIAEALEQDFKVMAYSGELPDYHFRSWLDSQLAGREHIVEHKNHFGDLSSTVSAEAAEKIGEWYREKMYIYDNNTIDNDSHEFESLLTTIELAIQRYDLNLICIDNLMTALDISAKDDLYRAQSKFVHELKKIAVKYNIAVILVAHPKKSNAEFSNDDVSGSADITNRVDVVMNYSRAGEGVDWSSDLLITKNRLTGKLVTSSNPIKLVYSEKSKRIKSFLSGSPYKKYSWESMQYDDITLIDDEILFY